MAERDPLLVRKDRVYTAVFSGAASEEEVKHYLDREPVGYIVIAVQATGSSPIVGVDAYVYDSTANAHTNQILFLMASAACTVKILIL